VSFLIDDGNSQQVTKLNLTPLLLAKLLTNSYTGNTSTEPALAASEQPVHRSRSSPRSTRASPSSATVSPPTWKMVMLGAGDQSDTIWR